jgi:hypothetical protein
MILGYIPETSFPLLIGFKNPGPPNPESKYLLPKDGNRNDEQNHNFVGERRASHQSHSVHS